MKKRTTFLCTLLVIGVVAFFPACHKPGSALPRATYTIARCTHSIGLCNLPLFISAEEDLGKEFGVKFELVNIPNWGDHASAITAGRVDFSVTPFTNVMTAYANGAPIKVVSGSGINGLFLIGKSDLATVADLKGKKIGTFQSDTLEMLLFSALHDAGLTYKDVEVIYFTDGFEMINAFATGRVQAITHVEPYATQAVQKFGGKKLASGKDIWRGDHPDCVLTVSEKVLKQNPALVKGVIRAMLRAQLRIETDRETTVKEALGKYYKADLSDVLMAAEAQPPGVDIRSKLSFMVDRFRDLQKLNYVKPDKTPDGLFDFSLLNEAVREDADVVAKLKFKSEN
jgi:NitT/TauT family transport system substrate-binding protein